MAYIIWLFTAVLTAKIGVVAVAVRVTVFEPAKRYSSSATLYNEVCRSSLPSSRVPVPKFKQR